MESLDRFLTNLQAKRVHRDVEDKVIWTASRSENFLVKSLYLVLELDNPLLFPSSIIWRSCTPPKVAFFSWEATQGKALTLDQVQRREFSLTKNIFFATLNKKLSIVFFFTEQRCGFFDNCFFFLFSFG